jgi:colicin import membrane protein
MSDPITDTAITTPGAGSPDAAAGGATPAPTPGERTFTQDDVERIVKDRLAAEQDRAKRAQAEAARKAAEEAAAKAGEWQTVAEQRKAAAEAAEAARASLEARYAALAETVTKQARAQLKALPDELKALAPAGDDPAALIAWLEQVRPLAAKLQTPPTPGTPAGPRGSGAATPGGPSPDDLLAQKRARIGAL